MDDAESQCWAWLSKVVRGRGLEIPDGRPLYQYGLAGKELAELRHDLIGVFGKRFDQNSNVVGSALCFWVAYWYQRSYNGGQHVWKAALREIGADIEPGVRSNLIKGGLSYLRRGIRRINGEFQYLATVMMEGGFPSRMVAAQAHWLHRYVEAVVIATTQGELSTSASSGHAEFYQYLVPPTFRAPHFVELVAELALKIAELRRQIAQAGITAGAVEWLDQIDPRWREKLPIRTDDDAAKRLVEGLVRAKEREAKLPVECRRFLTRDGSGAWKMGIRLQIDGELRDEELPPLTRQALGGYSRARLRASGELARLGHGPIGVASRSGNVDDPSWEVRSLFATENLDVRSFPRDQDVVLHFAAGQEVFPEFVPSGGSRVTSDILVFGVETREDDSKLSLIGTGSVRDTRTRLYVAVPPDSKIVAVPGSEVADAGWVEGLKLVCVTGSATVDVEGDRYGIHSGSETGETARLEAVGETLPNVEAKLPVFRGAPEFFVIRGILRSRSDGRYLRVRALPAKGSWAEYRRDNLPIGALEVGLFEDGVCLDRLRLVHLPTRASIEATVPTPGTGKVRIDDFGGASFELLGDTSSAKLSRTGQGAVIEVAGTGANVHVLRIRSRWESSEAVFEVPALTRHIAFYDADRKAFAARAHTSVPGLLGASAQSVGRSSILISLRSGPEHRRTIQRRTERVLPFSQMRDDVERLFSMSDDLDAEVMLEAIWYGTSVADLRVKRFDLILEPDGDRSKVFLASDPVATLDLQGSEIEVVGRPFKDFDRPDRSLECVGEGDRRHWAVPDGEGPWVIYAKVDGIPRSRPVLVHRTLTGEPPTDGLVKALLQRHKQTRETMLLAELGRVERGEAPDTCDRIASFVGSLDPALPFQSFDVLRALPWALGAAARIAVVCPESVLPRVLDLEARMPLTWCLSRPEAWDGAFGAMRERLRKVFRDVGADEGLADEAVIARADAICARQPCLAMHMAWTLSKLGVTIGASAREALRRAGDLVGRERALALHLRDNLKKATIEARARNGERTWPTDFGFRNLTSGLATADFEMHEIHQAVLDAPCFASGIALGRIRTNREVEENIRMARSFDPHYFEEAFVIAITLGKGRATC